MPVTEWLHVCPHCNSERDGQMLTELYTVAPRVMMPCCTWKPIICSQGQAHFWCRSLGGVTAPGFAVWVVETSAFFLKEPLCFNRPSLFTYCIEDLLTKWFIFLFNLGQWDNNRYLKQIAENSFMLKVQNFMLSKTCETKVQTVINTECLMIQGLNANVLPSHWNGHLHRADRWVNRQVDWQSSVCKY